MQYAKGIQSKQHIFQITKELMRVHGYKDTTYQMIAKEAEAPTGLVNYYYKKQDFVIHIYQDFFKAIADCIYKQVKKAKNNKLLFHILESRIFMTQLFSDKDTLRFHLEIHQKHIIPEIIQAQIHDRLISIIKDYKLERSTDEVCYWYAIAENGSIQSLLNENADIDTTGNEFQKLLNLVATIAVKLAGLSQEIIQSNLEEAISIFPKMKFQEIKLL